MITEQEWLDAKEEFGVCAVNRFYISNAPKCWIKLTIDLIDSLFKGIVNPNLTLNDISIAPIETLFEHDVQVYGENAYLMWLIEDFHYDDMTLCNADDNDNVIDEIPNIVRKKSAALPFDLDSANAGDIVEELYSDGSYRICNDYDFKTESVHKEITFTDDDGIFRRCRFDMLQMKYPPKAKQKPKKTIYLIGCR